MISTQWASSIENDRLVDGMGFSFILVRTKIGRTNKDLRPYTRLLLKKVSYEDFSKKKPIIERDSNHLSDVGYSFDHAVVHDLQELNNND